MLDAQTHALVTAGRHRFADAVETLDGEQLDLPTLCAGWDARTLTAHLLLPFEVSFPRFVWTALWHRGDTDRTVDAVTRRLARRPMPELVASLRGYADRAVAPRRVSPDAQLVETAVHLRDLARPLGLPVDVPGEHWAMVLDHLHSARVEPALVPPGRLVGLEMRATDLDPSWRTPSGAAPAEVGGRAEVRGPAEALAMALTGRRSALADLTGDGVAVLAGRLA